MFEKKSKEKRLIEYFTKNKQITTWTAITRFRITRLSDVIFRLRNKGWEIDTERKGKENYAVYTLKNATAVTVTQNDYKNNTVNYSIFKR